jgi:H+/Cl- antiporter ClcA
LGTVAFLLDILNESLYELRWSLVEQGLEHSPAVGWLTLVGVSVLYVILSSTLCCYLGPTAIGSGVAEAMGILNGVYYPDYIGVKVFITKFFGLAFAVAGGICGGKEGPLVHMGSIVGYATPYIPNIICKGWSRGNIFKYFQCDVEKRKLLAVGTAAGVSAAFGAPIGGSLFAYEISRPDTFWSFSLTWKVFFASSISTFTLSIWQ